METKVCTKCGKELPATDEYFHRRNGRKLRNECKECRIAYSRNYYKENRGTLLDKKKDYYIENREEKLDYNKRYYGENKDKLLERNKNYISENLEKVRSRQRAYYYENKEFRNASNRTYYKQNKNRLLRLNREYRKNNNWIIRRSAQLRRARFISLPNTLTEAEWNNAVNYFNNSCCYCGGDSGLEQEHFWPLSLGGGYTKSNIIPACKSCNTSKKNKPFEEWYPTHESYSPEREAKIYQYFEQLALENGGWGRRRHDLGTVTVEVINEDL